MKKSHKYLYLLLLTACAAGGRMVTMDEFYEVPIGATAPEVVSYIGKPYAIHEKSGGVVEYEYVERIKIGARDAEERHYYILLQDGKVTSKRVKTGIPSPYYMQTFDSYEMQTTQKGQN